MLRSHEAAMSVVCDVGAVRRCMALSDDELPDHIEDLRKHCSVSRVFQTLLGGREALAAEAV
eukprot:8208649-Lingulodinium_polyedra.AAC.1